MKSKNEKALIAGTIKASGKRNQKRQYMAVASDLKEQHRRILAALRISPRTSYELRREPVGSYQCPTRIHELRALGYRIETHRVVVVDQDGFTHPNVALYTLLAEPCTGGVSPLPRKQPCAPSGTSAEVA